MSAGNPSSPIAPPKSVPPPRVDPKNRQLALVGNIVSGIGVVSFLGGVASLVVARDAAEKRGYPQGDRTDVVWAAELERLSARERAAKIAVLTTGIGAVAMVGGGVAMIVIARRREEQRRERLGLTAWAPVVAPGYVGAQWALRW